MNRLLLCALTVAVLAAMLMPSLTSAQEEPTPPGQAPFCTPEQAQARLAATLRRFQNAGWKLTDAASRTVAGSERSIVDVSDEGTSLTKLAGGYGKAVPASRTPSALRKSVSRPRGTRALSSVQGHELVWFYCNYSGTANLMYWTGATSSTYVNFLIRSVTGAEDIKQTPHLSCSVVEAPCLWLASDNAPDNWRVISGVYFARFASHSLYDKWCS